MKKYLPFLLIYLLFIGCKAEQKFLTQKQIKKEKQQVMDVIERYNTASEEKNFSAMVETLADEVIFFGTDSSEIIRTFADFKKTMKKQWEQFEKIHFGELSDVSIQMDDNATFASIIFGVPCQLTFNGETKRYFLRGSRTLKKENDKWVIVSGILSVVSSNVESPPPVTLDNKDK